MKLYRLKHSDDELFYCHWHDMWVAKGVSDNQSLFLFFILLFDVRFVIVIIETIGNRFESIRHSIK